jgi:hypothetical protein
MDYKTLFSDEAVPTVIVNRPGVGEVRINEADFDPKHDELSPNSHRTPANYTPPKIADDPPPSTGKGGKGGKGGKNAPDGDRYTIEENGKFYLSDKDGKKLNETPFDTAELAAAAEITVTT